MADLTALRSRMAAFARELAPERAERQRSLYAGDFDVLPREPGRAVAAHGGEHARDLREPGGAGRSGPVARARQRHASGRPGVLAGGGRGAGAASPRAEFGVGAPYHWWSLASVENEVRIAFSAPIRLDGSMDTEDAERAAR
jgi:hypothetical protein